MIRGCRGRRLSGFHRADFKPNACLRSIEVIDWERWHLRRERRRESASAEPFGLMLTHEPCGVGRCSAVMATRHASAAQYRASTSSFSHRKRAAEKARFDAARLDMRGDEHVSCLRAAISCRARFRFFGARFQPGLCSDCFPPKEMIRGH